MPVQEGDLWPGEMANRQNARCASKGPEFGSQLTSVTLTQGASGAVRDLVSKLRWSYGHTRFYTFCQTSMLLTSLLGVCLPWTFVFALGMWRDLY